jgi:polar amino acid transport system substrate-binding protein
MSKTTLLRLILASVLIPASIAAAQDEKAIRIRADVWLPYNGPSRQNPPGYMIEMAKTIAEPAGYAIDYAHMPWEDALAATRKGTYDCVVGAYKSDAEDFRFPALSWGRSSQVSYALDDKGITYEGLDSLKNLRLAVIEGYSYGDDADAYIKQHAADPKRIVLIKSSGRAAVSAVSMLIAGKADLYFEDANVMNYTLQTLAMERRVIPVGVVGETEDVYIACTPANERGARFAKLFGDGTPALRANGTLAKILAKYGLRDWGQP